MALRHQQRRPRIQVQVSSEHRQRKGEEMKEKERELVGRAIDVKST